MFRSSHPEVFCKNGALITFVKFAGKHLGQILFFKNVACLSCFPVNFVKLLKALFFIEHRWWLLLNIWFLLTFC